MVRRLDGLRQLAEAPRAAIPHMFTDATTRKEWNNLDAAFGPSRRIPSGIRSCLVANWTRRSRNEVYAVVHMQT